RLKKNQNEDSRDRMSAAHQGRPDREHGARRVPGMQWKSSLPLESELLRLCHVST
ncbi:Uncharacterized protein DAT39_018466, partial [Clarias magur]